MIVGYNIYLDGVKVNPLPVAGPPFTFEGLPSDTDFSVTIMSIDDAGKESPLSDVFPASTLQYVPPVTDGPLSGPDAAMVDQIVAEELDLSKAPGIAVALAGPRGYYRKGYGVVAAGGRAVTVDDHWKIASSTKSFTATAVLQAVDRGELSLDDTLDQFITGVPKGNEITIRHMLMMRSGVYDYQTNIWWLIAFTLFPTMEYTEDAILLLVQGNGSQFPPGTAYQYTNSNYVLLGIILRKITGRPIKQILSEDVLGPAGLSETKWPNDSAVPPPAGGATFWNPGFFCAAGALTSTVGDMLKWAAELRDSTLLSSESADLRNTTFMPYDTGAKPPMPTKFGYGLGMESTGTWLGHNGSLPGWDCQLAFDTVSGATFACAENMQTVSPNVLSAYTRIFARIADYLYPGSMDVPNYSGKTIRPLPRVMSLVGGRPNVSVTVEGAIVPNPAVMSLTGGQPVVTLVRNKIITPNPCVMSLTGGTPGSGAPIIIRPNPAAMSLTGGTPGITVNSFTPFNVTTNKINQPVPVGATGCYVTLLGAGGGGGSGRRGGSSSTRRGGGGGGGGAKVFRTWIPIASLGSTYSLTQGLGGAGAPGPTGTAAGDGSPGTAGGFSQFTSGAITMTANGGGYGSGGGSASPTPAGAGGTASVSGISATTANGTAGGGGTSTTSAGLNFWDAPNNTAGGAAGGGGGGGINSSNTRSSGGSGGDTTTGTGGAGGTSGSANGGIPTDQAAGDPGPGGGGSYGNGAGGTYGAKYGGGGGGGGAATTGSIMYGGGTGRDGYILVEWVDT